jgi:SAM-dependent methyltransferase
MTQNSSSVPLAVWPCAQRSCREQRRGRYLSASSCRPGELLPALAQRVIDTYSDPGDLVVDPCCASGTALVEAVHLGRDALGVEADDTCADVAARNIETARSSGAPGRARVLAGDGRDLPRVLARREARELVAPPGERVARLPFATAALVMTALPSARPAAFAQYAASAAAVVKPGGFMVLVIDRRRAGSGLAGELVQLLQRLGLLYWQHVVGLVAEIRGEQLRCRGHRARGAAVTTCHEDVLVFRRPELKR